MKRIIITALLGIIISHSQSINGQEGKASPIKSITEAEMRDHIFFLASDYMAGRSGPSAEYEIAAQYVATQFASAGLEPMLSDIESMQGYFQIVPFEKVVFDKDSKWILHSKTGEKAFEHIKDYKILEGRVVPDKSLDVVFAGFGISEPDQGWDDFKNIDIEGKMAIVMAGAPMKKGVAVLPEDLHNQYSSMQGLQKKFFPLMERKPAAVIILLDKETSAMIPYDMIPSNFSEEVYKYMGSKKDVKDFVIPMIYLLTDEVARAIFEDQKYDPVNIAEDGIKKYKTYELENVSIETVFTILEKTEISLKNVVGIVKGTDPELSNEYITVGAHLDHVASGNGEVTNGADDNASGSAGVMEIAEAVAMNPPRRSVVFITYTAEEMGLHGSHYFVNSGPLAIEEMKFNVNLDMIGRTIEENKATGSHYVLADKKFMDGIEPFITEINNESIQIPLIFDRKNPYSGSSDHASYSDVGIPSFFFYSGPHEDLHAPGDDAEKIEYDKAVKLSRLAYQICMKLANMDEVPAFTE
jgi:hypothetical protein